MNRSRRQLTECLQDKLYGGRQHQEEKQQQQRVHELSSIALNRQTGWRSSKYTVSDFANVEIHLRGNMGDVCIVVV